MEPFKDVVEWYREALPLNGWEVQSDAVDESGAVIIYAEKAKQPLWITLRANVGSPGTTYRLMGGVVEPDSTKAQSGSSMSSNHIQRRKKKEAAKPGGPGGVFPPGTPAPPPP